MTQVHAQQVSFEAIPVLPLPGSPCIIGLYRLTGGVASVLQGGKFGHGFLSAGFAKAVTTYLPFDKLGLDGIGDKYDGWEYVAGRTTVAAISGGTASVIGGGKFENGAKTAALAHLLNSEMERVQKALDARNSDMIKVEGAAALYEYNRVMGLKDQEFIDEFGPLGFVPDKFNPLSVLGAKNRLGAQLLEVGTNGLAKSLGYDSVNVAATTGQIGGSVGMKRASLLGTLLDWVSAAKTFFSISKEYDFHYGCSGNRCDLVGVSQR